MSPVVLNRRELIELGVAASALAVLPSQAQEWNADTPAPSVHSPRTAALRVNNIDHRLELDIRATLLDTLRETIGLTGTKKGCDRGECGACTVHIDGRRALACLTLSAMVEGRDVVTIEGLAENGDLHAVQAAFIEHDAFQCGFCTPGQIMSAVSCIREGNAGSDDDVREFMSGNICRCSAYPQIVAAVRACATLEDI